MHPLPPPPTPARPPASRGMDGVARERLPPAPTQCPRRRTGLLPSWQAACRQVACQRSTHVICWCSPDELSLRWRSLRQLAVRPGKLHPREGLWCECWGVEGRLPWRRVVIPAGFARPVFRRFRAGTGLVVRKLTDPKVERRPPVKEVLAHLLSTLPMQPH